MNTDRDFRSRISIDGSKALNGSAWALMDIEIALGLGWSNSNRGVEQYPVNY
jgi:hypothetical protein